MTSFLARPLLLAVGLTIACGPEKFQNSSTSDSEHGAAQNVKCVESSVKVAPSGCGTCVCRGDEWKCEETGTSSDGACNQACANGTSLPPANHCGVCTCIEGQWICDQGCECEHNPAPSMDEPRPIHVACLEEEYCAEYGSYELTSCTGGQEIPDQPLEPGEDPFATDTVVYCESVIEHLSDYRDGEGGSVTNIRTEGTQLLVDVEYLGGCGEHRFGLCHSNIDTPEHLGIRTFRTFHLKVAHDSDEDVCGKRQQQTLRFDVSGLSRDFQQRTRDLGLQAQGPVLLQVSELEKLATLRWE